MHQLLFSSQSSLMEKFFLLYCLTKFLVHDIILCNRILVCCNNIIFQFICQAFEPKNKNKYLKGNLYNMSTNDYFAHFGLPAWIEKLCKEKGKTISEVETELGFSQGLISRWNYKTPTLKKIKELADYLNVSMDYLVGENVSLSPDKEVPEKTVKVDSDIVSIQRAREKMSNQDKSKMMKLLKTVFEEEFKDDKQ